jgi:hypothetical protein
MNRPETYARALPHRHTIATPLPVRREPAANASSGGATNKGGASSPRPNHRGGDGRQQTSSNPPPIVLPLRSCCFHRKRIAGGEEATGKLRAKEVHRSRALVPSATTNEVRVATTSIARHTSSNPPLSPSSGSPRVSPEGGGERNGRRGQRRQQSTVGRPAIRKRTLPRLDEGHRPRGHQVTRRRALAQAARGRCDDAAVADLPLEAIVGWR